MCDRAKISLAFVLGAAAGVLAAWGYLKQKYEAIAQEEIDSVKAVFAKKHMEQGEKVMEGFKDDLNNPADKIKEYSSILRRYTSPEEQKNKSKTKDDYIDEPYVISPDDFGELEDYEKISLTYYSDNVLTDEGDEPVDDIESIVGVESLKRFGEYEEDSVFVRNDRIKCDFEILKDNREYEMEER